MGRSSSYSLPGGSTCLPVLRRPPPIILSGGRFIRSGGMVAWPFLHPEPAMREPRDVLQKTFGFPEFRDGQHAVVEKLLAGKSVLALFPTGGGTSISSARPRPSLHRL